MSGGQGWTDILALMIPVSLQAGAIQFYENNGVDFPVKFVFDNVENPFGQYSDVKVLKQWVWEKQCPSVLPEHEESHAIQSALGQGCECPVERSQLKLLACGIHTWSEKRTTLLLSTKTGSSPNISPVCWKASGSPV